ncbi:MAG: flagellar hook-basal body protein [Synergistales bacterium]|nr:flagellar hook-basal body protein [Synergistales bacterium]
MFRGLYAGASAMLVQQSRADVTANNLANVDTAGFRRRIPVNKSFPELLMERIENPPSDSYPPKPERMRMTDPIGTASFANVLSETVMTTGAGPLHVTHNPLDAAINGEGYFEVSDGAGNTFYTRSGQFTRDGVGRLVTHDGRFLQGQGGRIETGSAVDVSINDGGQVIADGQAIDQLRVVRFEQPTYLRQVGDSLLTETDASGAPQPLGQVNLVGGAVEESNVNVVQEMVGMIEANRAYEAAAKTVTIQDQSAEKLITSYGA